MTPSILFLLGIGVTLLTSLAIIAYLRSPLHNILVELCGTDQRVAFWAAFTNVTITLVPVIFAMQYTPEVKPGTTTVFELATQVKWAFAGLLSAVVMLAWVLSRFIPGQQAKPGAAQAGKAPA